MTENPRAPLHVMVDLETMGTGPNAAIVAIGAVVFSRYGLETPFYRKVQLHTATSGGGIMDPDTIIWWLQQTDAARLEITTADTPLGDALHLFKMFVKETERAPGGLGGVWGNGAGFDNVVLANAYRRRGELVPWPHWADRCHRTAKNMFPDIKPAPFHGIVHNALDDARSQAEHLIAINTEHFTKTGENLI